MRIELVPSKWRQRFVTTLCHPLVTRLRFIRQRGMIAPTGATTRYDHSLGVAELGLQSAAALRARYPDRVSETAVALVGIAALLHDVGHGPLSHMFDDCHFPRVATHEHRSAQHASTAAPYLDADQLAFVRHCIAPDAYEAPPCFAPGGLAAIVVANSTGFDVDRVDYVERDARACGVGLPFAYHARTILAGLRLDTGGALVLTRDAEHHVEQMMKSRAWMISHVYTDSRAAAVHAAARRTLEAIDSCGDAGSLIGAPGVGTMAAICNNPTLFALLDDRCFAAAARNGTPSTRAAACEYMIAERTYLSSMQVW